MNKKLMVTLYDIHYNSQSIIICQDCFNKRAVYKTNLAYLNREDSVINIDIDQDCLCEYCNKQFEQPTGDKDNEKRSYRNSKDIGLLHHNHNYMVCFDSYSIMFLTWHNNLTRIYPNENHTTKNTDL